jgi:uncharacterized membrane protein YbhN (UPF0104 family)
VSYLLYGSYDLLGRAYTKHAASVGATLAVAMTGLALNLNLGSMIGAVAARFRLYTRLGVSKAAIARILALSVATNWFGHMMSAGLVFASGRIALPESWAIDGRVLQVIGVLLLGASATYLALCAWSVRRSFTVRAHTLILPSFRMALLQLALAMANWAAMATIVWVLLDYRVAFPTVLGVFLLASVAALITHIPAGLGALEAVFLALLSPPLTRGAVIAALLTYRAVYYLLPLAFALVTYFVIEVKGRRKKAR